MIDTNSINQVLADGHQIKDQVQSNWPLICAAAVIVARELRNFNVWVVNVSEFVIAHGGVVNMARKLIWNPAADQVKRS